MKIRSVFSVMFSIMLAFCVLIIGCGDGAGNGNEETTPSLYAGTWESNQYEAKIVIDGELNATLYLKRNGNWVAASKGTIEINGTNATFTRTQVNMGLKNEGTGNWDTWSNDPNDIHDPEVNTVLGESPMSGIITGSSVGSILFGHMVKQ
jgi:hypothetical protein